jgi:predicted DNA-binding protein
MSKTLSFVRFSPYTDLRINELMQITGQNKSVVIRTLVDISLNELTDEQGNWKINEKGSKGKGK